MSESGAAETWPLLEDGALRLVVEPALVPQVEPWIPLLPRDGGPAREAVAELRVCRGEAGGPLPTEEPHITFELAQGWVLPGRAVALAGKEAGVHTVVDLARRQATLRVSPGAEPPAGVPAEIHGQASIACALLLGTLGRALLHAAAVVGPDGRAWLLVGHSRSGKSTSCVTLVEAGWEYLSDDHVVLTPEGDGVRVEGWPRRFNLDVAWEAGAPVGRRMAVDVGARWPGRWRRSARLGGLLFPRVEADAPTAATPLRPAEVLVRLIQSTPWLLADRDAATAQLPLLHAASRVPAFALRLGMDVHRSAAALEEFVRPLVERRPAEPVRGDP